MTVTPNRPPPADVAAGSKLMVLTQKESWALVKQRPSAASPS